tara:strand:- start:87 stop:212 length:126 start_codon:yes stop_codon:yes gene_type:complete
LNIVCVVIDKILEKCKKVIGRKILRDSHDDEKVRINLKMIE